MGVDNPIGLDRQYALLVALVQQTPSIHWWKSRRTWDGTEVPQWFLVGASLPTGLVSMFVPERYWDVISAVEVANGERFDADPLVDVVNRLLAWRL